MANVNVNIATASGQMEACEIEWAQGPPVEMYARTPQFGTMHFYGEDLFDALSQLRQRLEEEGYRPLCNAARKDAYPSRMARQMAGGRKVYLLKNGMQARREDLVDAFEPAEFEQVGTVAEQRAAYEEWLRSLG